MNTYQTKNTLGIILKFLHNRNMKKKVVKKVVKRSISSISEERLSESEKKRGKFKGKSSPPTSLTRPMKPDSTWNLLTQFIFKQRSIAKKNAAIDLFKMCNVITQAWYKKPGEAEAYHQIHHGLFDTWKDEKLLLVKKVSTRIEVTSLIPLTMKISKRGIDWDTLVKPIGYTRKVHLGYLGGPINKNTLEIARKKAMYKKKTKDYEFEVLNAMKKGPKFLAMTTSIPYKNIKTFFEKGTKEEQILKELESSIKKVMKHDKIKKAQ